MRVVFVLLLSTLVAGCVSVPDGDLPDDGAVATVLPWTLTECRYIVGWSEADPAIVQANLPEGFTVDAGTPFGLPAPDGVARAIIGTEAFECAAGSGLNGTVEPMTYSSIWIPVAPPEEFVDPDMGAVYYKIHVLIPDAPRREAMRALGLSVGDGAVAWTQPPVPGSSGAELTIEGAGDFTLELLAPRSVPAGDGFPFMEITPAGEDGAAGFAVWKADFAWDEAAYTEGRGFITWPAGHWVTEAIGSERAPAQFHAGTWSFDGTVALPLPE